MAAILKKYHNLDLLKAIAIYFVVVYHFNFSDYNFISGNSWANFINYGLLGVFSTCVPIFFFVNGGLLLNKEAFDLRRHAIKTLQIIILTIVWGVITMVTLSMIWNEPIGFRKVFFGIKDLKQGWVNHLWFMEALVVIYFFFPLFHLAFQIRKDIFWAVCCLICFFTFGNYLTWMGAIFLSELSGKFLNTDFSLNNFSDFNPFRGIYGFPFSYFLVGGLVWYYRDLVIEKVGKRWAWAALVLSSFLLAGFAITYSFRTMQIWDVVFESYESIFTAINVLALFVITFDYIPKGWLGKLVGLVSENTLGIYFTHWILGNLLSSYTKYLPFGDSFATSLLFGLFVLLFSMAFVILLKKVPIINRLFSIG